MARINDPGTGHELNDEMTASVLPVTVFIAIEAVVGFFGNIIILLVYYKRYRRINFRYFVLALAIVDLTSCCTTLPGEIFSQMNWYDYQHGWICKVKSYFNVFTAWASASILLTLAVDRYRKICHPLNWQIRFIVAFRLCACCFMISALVASPVVILWGKMTYNYTFHGENVTVSVCEKSGDYADTLYPLIYVWFVYLVPVSIMIIAAMALNFRTARALFGHHVAKLTTAKDHSTNTGTSTVMTTESFDGIEINNQYVTPPTAFSEKNRKEKLPKHGIKHSDASQIINQVKNEIKNQTQEESGPKDSKPSDIELEKKETNFNTVETDIGSDSLKESKKVKGQFENDSGENYSTDDEICVGSMSGNKKHKEATVTSDHMSVDTEKKPATDTFKSYRKSKTMIMLILTSVFAITMALYIVLTIFVARPGGILKYMPDSQKAAFFFFWRLYFINSVVNPILYGFMDARFRSGLLSFVPSYIKSKACLKY